MLFSIVGCKNKTATGSASPAGKTDNWDRAKAELEYKILQAELYMAKTAEPYMVIDLRRNLLSLRLKATTVWQQPLDTTLVTLEDRLEFAQRFHDGGRTIVRFLAGKHLFEADKKLPDTILAIVGAAVNVNPDLLQRDVPARFQLRWPGNLLLEVRTQIEGKPRSPLKNVLVEVGQVLTKPFGESIILTRMDPEAALTLFRVAQKGLPTLVYPPQ